MFSAILADAEPHCLCHGRAKLMDLWGARLCLRNIDGIIDWVEEEADKRGLVEDPVVRDKMKSYLTRFVMNKYRVMRPFPVTAQWIAARVLRRKGAARRLLIKRLVLICIERSRRNKQP